MVIFNGGLVHPDSHAIFGLGSSDNPLRTRVNWATYDPWDEPSRNGNEFHQ